MYECVLWVYVYEVQVETIGQVDGDRLIPPPCGSKH